MKNALIIQGGGFRTAFSSGVLDVFLDENHNPFDMIVAVSGGAIAASYYLAEQKEHCFNAICFLSEKGRFVSLKFPLQSKPLMHVEIFHDISGIHFPFDKNKAINKLEDKEFYMVMTDRLTAEPFYCDPRKTNWEEAVIASCSLPFVTKANQMVNGRAYMDGAWGDPLPVEWAYRMGAKNITVIRTTPAEEKATKTWFDRLGEYYYLRNPKLREAFIRNHQIFNRSIDFMQSPPAEVHITQIAPDEKLKGGVYTQEKNRLLEDYLHGKEKAKQYFQKELSKLTLRSFKTISNQIFGC